MQMLRLQSTHRRPRSLCSCGYRIVLSLRKAEVKRNLQTFLVETHLPIQSVRVLVRCSWIAAGSPASASIPALKRCAANKNREARVLYSRVGLGQMRSNSSCSTGRGIYSGCVPIQIYPKSSKIRK
ncbi:hypothetical protein SCP_1003600 [Sparassis crispa]|uniref:Uncharacterized protein n=1 Tax=Sparassis crispa TaxID=139825 RepID=A0A401GY33_9APHY|nr:hypothetical protein SCP_1003600 [Sparassis crispa]GBE87113.1 hypothetical protein SCP_1003600 [Sparassis crispa]